MWICRLWCDFEEKLAVSIFFYAGKRGEVVGGVGGAGGGGGGAPLPLRSYCTILRCVRTSNDCGTYSLVYHTLYIGTSHTQTSIMFTRKKHLGPPGGYYCNWIYSTRLV